jgi:hypothetical protein
MSLRTPKRRRRENLSRGKLPAGKPVPAGGHGRSLQGVIPGAVVRPSGLRPAREDRLDFPAHHGQEEGALLHPACPKVGGPTLSLTECSVLVSPLKGSNEIP